LPQNISNISNNYEKINRQVQIKVKKVRAKGNIIPGIETTIEAITLP
jgi:hypothetical protein